jgi:hypothetical protein
VWCNRKSGLLDLTGGIWFAGPGGAAKNIFSSFKKMTSTQ